jgi:hypothetical protein
MIIKNKFVIRSVLVILLTGCIISAGCTSPQTYTSTQSNSSTIAITSQTLSPTITPETLVTTLALTPSKTSINSTTATPTHSDLTVTLNSAVKKTVIGDLTPIPGNIFLVLNVTIQNNDKNNDFEYTDSSFSIYDKVNEIRRSAITSIVASKLNSPIPATGRIPPKSTKTGQIVFGVMDSSNSYKFYVVDSRGTVLTSIDNIEVP